MEESTRERLITKCQQLSEEWNAHALNVLAWLTKDVEGRLLPLINCMADVRRIPQCGQQTSILIENLLKKLRPFYDLLTRNPIAVESTEEVLYKQLEGKRFHFPTQSNSVERRLQFTFEKMVDEVSNVRARNLIRRHLKQYRDTEPYINDANALWKWYGVGKQTVEHIMEFFEDFRAAYQTIIENGDGDDSFDDTEPTILEADYPFLTVAEQEFVSSFWKSERRYPVFYIALRYLQRATDRPTQTFARVNGIMGQYESLQTLATEYSLTFERTRQMSKLKIIDGLPVWNLERWATLEFFHSPLLTEATIHWEVLQKLEHIEEMSSYTALAILAALRPLEIIALRADGYKANARRGKGEAWEQPHVLFAYDKSQIIFPFGPFLKTIGHEALLQRIEDRTLDLQALTESFFQPDTNEQQRQKVLAILREVVPMFPDVEVNEDTILFRSNHTNYAEEFYQILKRRGEAMTVEDIYAEFREQHPEDHHTDSTFIRSYMWQDNRFEAVGRKSTYQLREWEQFAGSLQELAVHLLKDEAEPLPLTVLISRMTEHRSNTTTKSCESSIYLAVVAGTLQYFFTAENNAPSAFVGIEGKTYSSHFWISPLTVDGAVTGMHRFLSERGHWPYASSSDVIEDRLNYTLRKYTQRVHVTDEEYARFQQGMADIPPHQYPRNERDAIFMERCHSLDSFWKRHHRLPNNDEEPKLAKWYRETQAKQQQLDDFRKYHFERIGQKTAKPQQQLSFDFGEGS
ncbi:MAG: hypothetical protein J6W75_08280 [Bacteroidaceae bacterium]|nr:hypothetical protein [Bacteroidaceae bacterium]